MLITLDQQPCDVTADSTWEAIAEASALAGSRGRLIVEVIVDGARLSDEDVTALQHQSARAASIELTSAHVGALVGEVFAEAEESLAEANRLQTSAAEKLQAGQAAEAMRDLAQAIGIWQSTQHAVTLGIEAMAGAGGGNGTGEPADAAIDMPPLNAAATRLHQQLDGIAEALRQRDTIAIADALLYELPACVSQWREMLRALRRKALHQPAE